MRFDNQDDGSLSRAAHGILPRVNVGDQATAAPRWRKPHRARRDLGKNNRRSAERINNESPSAR
jgi:hypothetical protein